MGEVAVWLALRGLDRLDYSYRTDAIWDLHGEMRALADLVNNPVVMMLPRHSIKTNLFVEIRELAYAVEDMLDDLLPRRRGYKKLIPPSLALFPRRTQIRRFTNKVRHIRLRVEEYERSINGHRNGLDIIRPTTPPPPVGLVGLDHHVSLICQGVLLATSRQWPSVVTIVGMTGIGKTTLAGLVFDNLEIKQKFEVLAWLSLNTIEGGRFRMITGSSEHEEVFHSDYGDYGLRNKVRDLLQGRHYLIVLDHVEYNLGRKLKHLMDDVLRRAAVEGSCVLITTRSMKVAQRFSSTPPYELPLLNQEQSRELLQRYMDGGDCMDMESVHTLLKICGGLPLALNKAGVMIHNGCKQPGRTYREILKELEAPGNNIRVGLFAPPPQSRLTPPESEKTQIPSYIYGSIASCTPRSFLLSSPTAVGLELLPPTQQHPEPKHLPTTAAASGATPLLCHPSPLGLSSLSLHPPPFLNPK